MLSNQGEPQKNFGEKVNNNDKAKFVANWCVDATNASVSGKAIMECGDRLKNTGGGSNEINDEVVLEVGKGVCGNSLPEGINLCKELKNHLAGGESIKDGLGQVLGGNIIIDLGCGLVQEKNHVSELGLNLLNGSASREPSSNFFNKSQSNNELYKNVDASVNSVSHVSDSMALSQQGEEESSQGILAIRNNRLSRNRGRGISSCKRHGMVTRKDRSKEVNDSSVLGSSCKRKESSTVKWDLEMEIAKVMEKGIELGILKGLNAGKGDEDLHVSEKCQQTDNWRLSEEVAKVIEVGIALGFDFNGKVDYVSEEIRRRVVEDELRVNVKQ